ncbi:putative nitrogenase cofactor biosynthesis protein NifB [Spirochaetia bacterium]|nr:putative nitrogenase cofactor biosynthesis protein NifB [Spirochaetia bacterium]
MNEKQFEHISNRHPCFSQGPHLHKGRIHLPVSPACNIQCRFCSRVYDTDSQRPGVTRSIISPGEAAGLVGRALELEPNITVVGIAGPGDTLATPHAIETFRLTHKLYPQLINCLSTNGLLLEKKIDDLVSAGVQTLTVTINAVDPQIQKQICSHIIYNGERFEGDTAASILTEAQKRGVRLAVDAGMIVKINTVLIPSINGGHIGAIAETVKSLGAKMLNIIPLIPNAEFSTFPAPACTELSSARSIAEKHLTVFKHCQHCRADACGIPGKSELRELLYGGREQDAEQTFSHG